MDPSRKRTIRFVVALTAAMLLAGALIYTSFNASTETVQPSQLLAAASDDRVYELTGKVERGSWRNGGDSHSFRVEDRAGGRSVPVTYDGPVPDPFREGREVRAKEDARLILILAPWPGEGRDAAGNRK